MKRPDYREYLDSEAWAAKRKERFEIDRYRCQKCLGSTVLQVHHRTYRNLGDEPMDDLVTLCQEDHYLLHDLCEKQGKSRTDEKVLWKVTAGFLGEVAVQPEPVDLTSYQQAQQAIRKLRAPGKRKYFLHRVNKGQEPAKYRLAYNNASKGGTILDPRPALTAAEIISGGFDTCGRLSSKRSEAPAERSPAAGRAISSRIAVSGESISKTAGQGRDHGVVTLPTPPTSLGGYLVDLIGHTLEGDPIVILRKLDAAGAFTLAGL